MTLLQELVVGRGELHLNLFEPGTKSGKGERYIGHTPGFALTVREDSVLRKGVSGGKIVTTERHITERSYEGEITCDQMGMQNLALWFGADSVVDSVAATGADPAIVENFVVTRGLGYQLGMGANPLGHKNLTAVVFKISGVAITATGNVAIDTARGRFTVLEDAPDIGNGVTLTVEYKTTGYTRRRASGSRMLEGALRFVAFNPIGRLNDLYFPYVSIEPKGAIDLKTSDWQNMQYTITVLKLLGQDLVYVGNHD